MAIVSTHGTRKGGPATTKGAMASSMTVDPAREPELARCYVELGDPVAGYSPNFSSRLSLVGVAALVFPLGFVLLQRITLLGVILLVLGLVGVLFLIQGIWIELGSMAYRICPRGIVVLSRRRIEGFAWRDVASLELLRTTQAMGGWSLAESGTLSAIIKRRDGRRFVLKWLSPQAMGFVQGHVFAEMAPRVRDELNRGQSVRFGEVEMSPGALFHKRERIAWESVEKVEFSHTVVVHKRDGTRAYLFNVANLDLFLALANARLTTGRFDLPGNPANAAAGPDRRS
jgi:hypothetical protein